MQCHTFLFPVWNTAELARNEYVSVAVSSRIDRIDRIPCCQPAASVLDSCSQHHDFDLARDLGAVRHCSEFRSSRRGAQFDPLAPPCGELQNTAEYLSCRLRRIRQQAIAP